MAYEIHDDCICCGVCADECQNGAISKGDGKYEIDTSACNDCGACANVCPRAAIWQE